MMSIKTGILGVCLLSISQLGQSQVNFQTISFDEALKKAKEENKMVFVDVYTTWCGPCKKMDSQVFSNADVGKRINRDFISIKIDHEKDADRAKVAPYGIKGYPTMLALDSYGKELIRVYGYHDVNELLKRLDKLLPAHEQPLNIAKSTLDKNPDEKTVWQEKLEVIRGIDYDLFTEYSAKYVAKFGLNSLDTELDSLIFSVSTLPLSNPVVQSILKNEKDESTTSWYYHKYKVIEFQSRYSQAKTKAEKDGLKTEASAYYDKMFDRTYGDMETKDYFMENIFGKEASTEDSKSESKEVPVGIETAVKKGKKSKKIKK